MNEHATPDKFRRYRERKRAAGLRQIRLWVPDINAPGFRERLERACEAINVMPDSDADAWLAHTEAEMASWDDWTVADDAKG